MIFSLSLVTTGAKQQQRASLCVRRRAAFSLTDPAVASDKYISCWGNKNTPPCTTIIWFALCPVHLFYMGFFGICESMTSNCAEAHVTRDSKASAGFDRTRWPRVYYLYEDTNRNRLSGRAE